MKTSAKLAIALCLTGWLAVRFGHGRAPGAQIHHQAPSRAVIRLLKQADAAFAAGSYAEAIPLYRAAKAAGSVPDPDGVDYRIATCLVNSQQWDAAYATIEFDLSRSHWKARVHYLLGRYYAVVPGTGYKVGDQVYRGGDYPTVAGAEKPVQADFAVEDSQDELTAFETAKVEAQQERGQPLVPEDNGIRGALPPEEEVDLNLDLAAFLPQQQLQGFEDGLKQGRGFEWAVDTSQPYNPVWPMPRKVLYLYNEVPGIDASPGRHQSALALLAKGLFIKAYRRNLDQWASTDDNGQPLPEPRPYPFQWLQPIPVWRSLLQQFPRDPIGDKTLYLIATTDQQDNNLTRAFAEFGELIRRFPRSKWVSDCRGARQGIAARQVSFSFNSPLVPGVAPVLSVSASNAPVVEFEAFPLRLENWLLQPAALQASDTQFTSWLKNLGELKAAEKRLGFPIARWSWRTWDKGDYQPVSGSVKAPLWQKGAYLVVASVPQVHYAQILVISDLAIVKKIDRRQCLCFIADARTGAPVMGARVVIKETYWLADGTNHVSVVSGQSNDGGFYAKPMTEGAGLYGNQFAAFAYVNGRYALTEPASSNWQGGDNAEEARVLPYTDRPVYRPGQKVYFRALIAQRAAGGDWEPVTNTEVHVTVTSPKGDEVFDSGLLSSEYGTVNGSFVLAADAALGEYNLSANLDSSDQDLAAPGASTFRVEEYKRPEYEVTVTPPAAPPRPGSSISALIKARYYFGAPVTNAKVKYTVRRSDWWPDYHFPEPFDWLYQYWGAGDYDTGQRNIGGEGSGTIVKEGTVDTDAEGNAEVSFNTAPAPKSAGALLSFASDNQDDMVQSGQSNPLYTVEAEVTDASRRTIESQGEVRVANQQYFAFLNTARDYYLQGDRVPVEIHTQDANDQPFAAAGKMVVYRLLPGDKSTKVFSDPVQTDANGRCFWNWDAKAAGQYSLEFEATDGWGQPVTASTTLWIAGPGLNTAQTRLQGISILMDKRDYTEGDSIHALLVADNPGTTVLLTQEAGADILVRNVYFIPGKSLRVTIPVSHVEVPNFFLAAAAVRDYKVYQAQQEVFVPPVRQLIHVEVTGNKTVYEPGETGTFMVKATDYAGRPVRGEFSLALIDASLFYIQKSYMPDLRTYYYADRRADSVNLDNSEQATFDDQTEDDSHPRQYDQHDFEAPDGLGLLNITPGQFGTIYAAPSPSFPPMALASVFDSNVVGRHMDGSNYSFVDGHVKWLQSTAFPQTLPANGTNFTFAGDTIAEKAPSGEAKPANAPGAGSPAPPPIRTNFAETAFWSPAVVTENGSATVQVTFPDSLTQWHASAVGLTGSEQVGSADADAVTKKDLIVRLQAPRFFVQRDQAVISANVNNYTGQTQTVHVTLSAGPQLTIESDPSALQGLAQGHNFTAAAGDVTVAPNAQERVNWCANVGSAGTVSLQVTAQTPTASDGVKMSYPVLVHGVERFAAQAGLLRGGSGSATATIQIPAQRRAGATRLDVQLNPSAAATMLDALPYLADYPYGCVEQTLSRFVPAVVAKRTLAGSGVSLGELKQRAEAYKLESGMTPVGGQIANSDYSYPQGVPGSRDVAELSSTMWHTDRWTGPVFDNQGLNSMIADGLSRLSTMQRGDGGWGWWPGSSDSDEYMSAYAVYGLETARAAGLEVPGDELANGDNYLAKRIAAEDNLHLLADMIYSLSLSGDLPKTAHDLAAGRLFQQRSRLTPYSQSLLAMALWNCGEKDKANVLLRNLENSVKVDPGNNTAYFVENWDWWDWWDNEDCTNATALRAFLLIDPANPLAAQLMNRMLKNARGNHWDSTRSTAETIYALAEYSRVNHELDADYTLKVTLNGNLTRTYHVNRENALFFDNRFEADDTFLKDGANTLTIEKQGTGTLYWNAYSQYFSEEEPIAASGNEISINRRYFKLTRNPSAIVADTSEDTASATPTPQEYSRTELRDGDHLQSGDLVEVELVIQSKNAYSYLVFEDMKPAGLEPVDLRSGYGWGDGFCSNVELRDDKVAFFVDDLPQGQRVLRYQMRAEIPGRFHALPTNGYAMYAPEVRAISNEMRLEVHD